MKRCCAELRDLSCITEYKVCFSEEDRTGAAAATSVQLCSSGSSTSSLQAADEALPDAFSDYLTSRRTLNLNQLCL